MIQTSEKLTGPGNRAQEERGGGRGIDREKERGSFANLYIEL